MPFRPDLNAVTDPVIRRNFEAVATALRQLEGSGGATISPSNTAASASQPFTTSGVDIQLLDEDYLFWVAVDTDTVADALARLRWVEADSQFQFDTGTTTRVVLTSLGQFGIGTTSPAAMMHAVANTDSAVALLGQAHSATQSADLLALLDSTSSAVMTVNPEGRVTAGGPAPVVAGALFSADGASTPGDGAGYYMKNVSGHLWRMLLDNTTARVTIGPHSGTPPLRVSTHTGDLESVLAVSASTTNVAFAARAAAGATAAVQEWQNNSGTAVASMSSAGDLTAHGLTIATGAVTNYVWATASSTGVGAWADPDTLGITVAAGWTDDGAVVRLTTAADQVGLGMTTPAAKLGITAASGEQSLRITNNSGSAHTLRTIEVFDGTHVDPTFYVQKNGFVKLITPSTPDAGDDTGVGVLMGDTTLRNHAAYNGQQGFQAQLKINASASPNSALKGFDANFTDVHGAVNYIYGYHSGFSMNAAALVIGNEIGSFVSSVDDNAGSGILTASEFTHFWARDTGNTDTAGGTTITRLYGFKMDEQTYDVTGIANFFGFASAYSCLIRNDSYLYWGSALTTAVGSRAAGIRWNSGGSTLDFSVGTTNRLTLSATTAAVNAALTANTFNGLTISSSTGTLTIANGKTLTASNTLTMTATDGSTAAFGAGGTVAYTSNKLSAFASTSSAELAGVISDETGSGVAVFGTNPTLTGATVSGDKLLHSGVLATIKSTQTTAPTVAAGAALGSGPTVSVQAGSTDICGLINLTAGTSTTTGTLCTVTFNGTYGGAPKMVLISYGGTASAVPRPYVSSITTTTFVVTAAVAPTASAVCSLYYFVIE